MKRMDLRMQDANKRARRQRERPLEVIYLLVNPFTPFFMHETKEIQ